MLSYDSPVSVNGQQRHHTDSLQQAISGSSSSSAMSAPKAASSSLPRTGSLEPDRHIWLVTGPAGCGKSTVAKDLSQQLQLPFIEADEYHPAANVAKMSNNQPLTDADRWDWLIVLREESMKRLQQGAKGVVLTCSALKRKYRDVIRVAGYYDPHISVHFIFLDATEELLLDRVARRQNHYMGAGMVHSQFADLERPGADEPDVVSVDVSGTEKEVLELARTQVQAIQAAQS
ncbi:hypothetical protein S40285_06991 [Stachybotrys chlorohalonatus IBT 40285]|uniref:Gluconokinase n=1 Tax=Stachybotrys chlorohalonatus (strain IBT 40285) TaxID=1283841 RepID=A0A084QFD5_STAC4|nr:hypothetical protein S40285_06991 [Stachybotrys chlorohalonata IBT 40285]